MSKRATLVLACVVLALMAYIVVFERTSLTSKELDQRSGKVLTAFVREKLERLEIQRKGKVVVLVRKPSEEGGFGPWQMLEPLKGEADESEIDQVLGELEWLDARRTLANISAKDRASFGLDKPRYRVTFKAGGITQRLLLGANDVHGQGVYAAVDDAQTAFVVPKTLLEALDHDPGHYRGKELFGMLVTAWGRKLSITGPEGKSELEKRDDRWWVVSGGGETFADPKGVESVLRALDDLRATRFLEGEEVSKARESLKQPLRSVQLRIVPDQEREDKKPELVELRVAGPCPGHEGESVAMAGDKGPPVCVADDDLKVFMVTADSLRQGPAIAAGPSEIERFEISAGSTKLSYKREGEEWLDAAGKPVDREAVEQWLEDLTVERALSFPKLSPLAERGRLTVYLADDKTQNVVVGDVAPDGSVLVRRDQEPTLVRYRAVLADLLVPTPRRFSSLHLWTHQPSEVQAFDVSSRVLQRKLVLSDGGWRTAAGTPEVSDSLRVRELLSELSRLRALAFVTEKPRPEHGLDAPGARLTLSLKDGKTVKLALGASTLKGAYARVDGGPVYDVPRELVNLVDELAGAKPKALPSEPAGTDEGALGEDEAEGHEGHDHEH